MAHEPESGRRIRAVQIAFSIIETLQEHDAMGVTEIAEELGHSKSTIHSHLRTLEDEEILVRSDGGYRLSLRMLDMAAHIRDQVGNYEVIKDEVDTLAEEADEIAQFGLEERGKVAYLYKSSGDRAVETRSRVGTRQPIYCTALGKTILAYLPSRRTEEIIQSIEFTSRSPNTITDPHELYEELEQIAKRGYGIDDEENLQGIRCIAAPVRNGDQVLGAISVTGPSTRMTDERLHGELADSVVRSANIIEVNTKFS